MIYQDSAEAQQMQWANLHLNLSFISQTISLLNNFNHPVDILRENTKT